MEDDRARVMAFARQVFGNDQKARRWLNKPKQQLGDRTPVEVMGTADGLRQVEELLIRIQEGYF